MKQVNFFTLLVAAIFLLCGTSCVSLSSMQTARTTPKGKQEIGLGGFGTITNEDSKRALMSEIAWEGWTRFGVKDNLDLGVKFAVGTSTPINVDTKWQIIGNQTSFFAMGTGLGVGIGWGLGPTAASEFIWATHLPIYTSFHPSDRIAIFATPQAIFQRVDGEMKYGYYGGSMGVFWGKKRLKLGAETSFYHAEEFGAEKKSSNILQGGFGFYFRL